MISPTKAKYFASVVRGEWHQAEVWNQRATDGLQLSDKVPMNRIILNSEALRESLMVTRGISPARIVAAFPADEHDKEDLSLYRLEFYVQDGTQLRMAVPMHLLDDETAKATSEELTTLVMASRGL